MNENVIYGAVGASIVFIVFLAGYNIGATEERRSIIDFGGFTQPWTSTKWTCEVKK